MALSNEDKKDVKGAFGKAIANKVSKVTRDSIVMPGHIRRKTNRTATDYKTSDGKGSVREVSFNKANFLRK